jgi:hypothetical protein
MTLKINTALFCLVLWAMPRLAAQCPLPFDISMDSTVNLLWEQYLERGDLKYEERTKRSFERAKKHAADPRLDSLFRLTRQYMVDHLGEQVFCEKIEMDFFDAFSNYSTFDVKYRLYFDKVGKKYPDKTIEFNFVHENKRGYDKQVYLPKLPNCRENPALCNFKITQPDQAIRIAQEAGWIKEDEVENCWVNDDWEWEIDKVVNDDCGMQKMYVDIYTGKTRLSDIYSHHSCTPLADKVVKSPIVIEGVVLEDADGYHLKGGIWSSRIVEVSRVFKGALKIGVVEVVSWGGELGSGFYTTSHGHHELPIKGQSAIFFLTDTTDIYDVANIKLIDSLSAYPIYQVHKFSPIALYHSVNSFKRFHLDIEKYAYQAIEKAAGQKRQTIMLPAERDSAFADWAMSKRMIYPQRKLGLEYLFMKKNGASPKDTARMGLGIRSPVSHSYLTKTKIVIRYSPTAYGDSIVSKKRVALLPKYRKEGSEHHYWSILPPGCYQFEFKDLSDSTFEVAITRPKDCEAYFQVTPMEHRTRWETALNVLEMKFPIINKEANLNLDFVESQMQDGHFHFDFEQQKEVPYKYVWPNDPIDFYDSKRRK